MGVEVAEMAQVPVETITEVHKSKENGKLVQGPGNKEPLNFGSHVEEPVEGEENNASKASSSRDAVEEWPTPVQVHSFWLVRYRTYDDPKIKAKIDQADKEIQKRNKARSKIFDELKIKRADRSELLDQLKVLRSEGRQVKSIMDEKKKELEPLQQALGKLRPSNNSGRSGGICSSEEELNDLIHSLQYCIQHESIPLSEEKQLLREIKQLEGTREKVVANDAIKAKIQESLGQKDVIQDQVKLIGVDLDGVKKERQALLSKITPLEGKVKAIEEDIKALQEELQTVTEMRDKAFASIQELRKMRDERNANFYQSRQVLTKARELAVKKDVKALKEFTEAEVENFMSLWNNKKAVRDDYEKRILTSLDNRQLSRDGRIRNPDEKPLVVVENPAPEPETVTKANVKQPKEEAKSTPKHDALPTQKVQKEAAGKATESKPPVEKIETGEIFVPKKPTPVEEVDEAKLKEMKREEEIAKAKQAMERKKKLAEKAAAKATIRAQKEAEKKLKEREKKAKKKAAASGPGVNEESAEAITEAEEENADVNEEGSVEAPVPAKAKVYKDNKIRHRTRPRGTESLPKAILKRRKATNYWVWAVPAAVAVLLALVLIYYYYLQ
ncbi:proton pump-interactor 1-like [Mangifera indica]|uniref:proton pump-interactor 1-like n=1 Tax=Mangifera indica TaxID=29780 RepID=UPI001CF9DADB|nr:proton pump-interactor 1-like [Mangifera indica]